MAREADDARSGAAALRGRAVLAQHGQEFLVRANEEGLVAGPEPGAPPGRMLQQLLVGRAPDGQHPRPRRQLAHGQPVQATARAHGQPRDQQRRPSRTSRLAGLTSRWASPASHIRRTISSPSSMTWSPTVASPSSAEDLAAGRQLERFREVVAGQREEDHDHRDVHDGAREGVHARHADEPARTRHRADPEPIR